MRPKSGTMMPGSQASGNKEEILGRDYTIRDDLFRRNLFRRKYIVKGGGRDRYYGTR